MCSFPNFRTIPGISKKLEEAIYIGCVPESDGLPPYLMQCVLRHTVLSIEGKAPLMLTTRYEYVRCSECEALVLDCAASRDARPLCPACEDFEAIRWAEWESVYAATPLEPAPPSRTASLSR